MATEVVVPMLGVTVEKGTIVEWLKEEGDFVEKGEIIFVVEVEKATTEVESPATGILAKIIIPVGVEVPILSVAAIITEEGEELPADYAAAAPAAGAEEPAADAVTSATYAEAEPETAPVSDEIWAVPAARQMAKDKGLDLGGVTGTGPDGIILVRDVEKALEGMPTEGAARVSTLAERLAEKEKVPLAEVEGTGVRGRIMRADIHAFLEKEQAAEEKGFGFGTTIPMSSVRKVIARKMSESAFTAPHIYFFTDVAMDALLAFRKAVVPDFEKHFDVRPSINDFLIKAVALNILDFPMLNARVEGEAVVINPEINVGLAVAQPEGLVVPAIPNSDRTGLVQIVRQRADLVERARKGRLSLEEMERGTFTISSLAQYDITHFTAILNPPQSGILSIGKTEERAVVVDGEVTVKRMASFGLSVDHRIIDGAVAGDFLQNLKWKLENPSFTFLAL